MAIPLSQLKELKEIDIQDLKELIDLSELKEKLLEHKEILIAIVIVGISFVVCLSLFKGRQLEIRRLREDITLIEKKIPLAKAYKENQAQLNQFKKDFPPALAANKLVELLNNMAAQHKINILSFSPAQDRSDTLYNQTSIQIQVSAENYTQLVQFVTEIEQSSYAIRLDQWSGYLASAAEGPRRGQSLGSNPEETISASIDISTLDLKR